MQDDQRYRGSDRVQAAIGLCGNVDGSVGGNQFRERHRYCISNAYLNIWVSDSPKAGRNCRNTRHGTWKADTNLRSSIAVQRRIFARHGIWLGTAVECGANPSKIEPWEVSAGRWIGALQEHVRRASLARG